MFIKKVTKRNGRTKKKYEYLYLVESVRTDKGPRQRFILNLGTLKLDPSEYDGFAKRIEEILTGQESLWHLDERLEKSARNAAREIFRKQAEEINIRQTTDFMMVDINSIEAEEPRSVGAEYIAHSIWEELGLSEIIRKQMSEEVLSLIKTLVIGRLVEPASELHTWGWARDRSAVYELVGKPAGASLMSLYRAGDRLFSMKDEIERHLSDRERDIFALTEKMFFFDLTNTYFEGKALANPKARYGRSKDKRNDCKLITLGLIIDEMGFAKSTRIFEGNKSEPVTLEVMIRELEKSIGDMEVGKKRTIVIDAGIAVAENLEYLKANGYHYIAVNRGKTPFDIDGNDKRDKTVVREDPRLGIKVEIARELHDGEVYIICRSEKKKAKETGIRGRVEELFLERLTYYRQGLGLKHRPKKYRKIVEIIGRLKEKYPKAAKLYDVKVIPEKGKRADDPTIAACDITWSKKESYDNETSAEGRYVLRTDRLDLSDSEIWEIYVMLTRIEYSFRCMKSSLGLRPNFHQKEHRVDAHLFISVLAYHILNIVEHRLRAAGVHSSWASVRDIFKTHERITISFKTRTEDGEIMNQFIRLNSKLALEQLEIYRILKLSPVPLPRKKLVSKGVVTTLFENS